MGEKNCVDGGQFFWLKHVLYIACIEDNETGSGEMSLANKFPNIFF